MKSENAAHTVKLVFLAGKVAGLMVSGPTFVEDYARLCYKK
jgi:hypothetical protein